MTDNERSLNMNGQIWITRGRNGAWWRDDTGEETWVPDSAARRGRPGIVRRVCIDVLVLALLWAALEGLFTASARADGVPPPGPVVCPVGDLIIRLILPDLTYPWPLIWRYSIDAGSVG